MNKTLNVVDLDKTGGLPREGNSAIFVKDRQTGRSVQKEEVKVHSGN